MRWSDGLAKPLALHLCEGSGSAVGNDMVRVPGRLNGCAIQCCASLAETVCTCRKDDAGLGGLGPDMRANGNPVRVVQRAS